MATFEENWTYYESIKDSLKDKKGQYALISDCKLHGIFDNYSDAGDYAYENFPEEEYVMQQIGEEDQVQTTTMSYLIGV